ncbi:MAG: nitroreductase/quinone reductase family protein [Acidimicrobiia bacterium]|nr:nitroreductase/quinone reductase family protein [Acidimicrobiia bacterium]
MPLDPDLIARLAAVRTIDFTTFGRRSGQPSRIEIWWFRFEDAFVITGTPGGRDWLANVLADQRVIVHAAGGDFTGRASAIDDAGFRRRFFALGNAEVRWYTSQAELTRLVDEAPMIRIDLD